MWNEKNGKRGKRNNLYLVSETVHIKIFLIVLAYLHLTCLTKKPQCHTTVKIIVIKNLIMKSTELYYSQISE